MNAQNSLDAFENNLSRLGKSKNTIRIYSNIVRQYNDSGFSDPLDWIIDARNNGASPSTLKSRTAAMKAWSGYSGADAARESLGKYKLPTVGAPSPHPVPGGIVIVRAAIALETSGAIKVAIALGGFAGLRVSETISVKPINWDRAANVLVITGKGGKTRKVPVSNELAEILEQNMPANPKACFVDYADRWTREKITKAFRRLSVTHHDGSGISSHDLRATFATEIYNKTADILLVQRLLGHSSVSQTQQYLGLADGKAHQAVNF